MGSVRWPIDLRCRGNAIVISGSDTRAFIDAHAEFRIRRDSDRMVKIFAAEAVFHERPSQPACRGIEAFRIYLEWLVTGGQRDMHVQREQFEQLDVGGDLAFSTGQRVSPGGRATACRTRRHVALRVLC